jgi:hypothetical protein
MLKINVKEFSFFHLVGYFVQHLDRGGTARRKCQKLQVFHFLRLSPSRPPGCDCTNIGNDSEWQTLLNRNMERKSTLIRVLSLSGSNGEVWELFVDYAFSSIIDIYNLRFVSRFFRAMIEEQEKWHCRQSCSSKLCPHFKPVPVLCKCAWGWRHYFGQFFQSFPVTQLPTWLLYFRRIRPCHAH